MMCSSTRPGRCSTCRLSRGDPALFRALGALKRADALAQAPRCAPRARLADELAELLDAVLAADEAFSLAQLAVDGRDVLALGVSPGPQVGAALQAALDAVIDEQVPNDPAALQAFLADWLARQ